MVQCTETSPETGVTCNFFSWLPGARTPSLSPRLGSTIQLPVPAFTQPNGGLQGLFPAPSVALRKSSCPVMGCNSTRIRKDCGRRMCKAHCREAGGCADPAHKVSQSNAISFMATAPPIATPPTIPVPIHPAVVLVNKSSTPASSIDPNLFQHQVQTPFASSSRVPVHSQTEPVFTSHISQVFSLQMAREEQMREMNRQREATRLESRQKAHQTVIVYAWMEVCFSNVHAGIISWFSGQCCSSSL